jgi:hypothetical protein
MLFGNKRYKLELTVVLKVGQLSLFMGDIMNKIHGT